MRIAVIGAGHFGRKHMETVRNEPRCELVSVADPDDYFDAAWRREPGGGPLLINLIHDIDDLRFICGEIVEVRAMVSKAVRNLNVEDTAAIALRFENGALGGATVSDTVAA